MQAAIALKRTYVVGTLSNAHINTRARASVPPMKPMGTDVSGTTRSVIVHCMSARPSSTSKHDQALFESIAQAYFTALKDGNLARVPWSSEVVLRAPLAARNPLVGRAEVEDYLGPLAGNLGEVQIREIFISTSRDAMAVEATLGVLHVLDKFVIRDGQIVEQQNFYDPRPLLDAPAPGGLTVRERALLIERLEGSRERLRELLSGQSKQALDRRPAHGGWTAMESAEHLLLSEETLMHTVRSEIMSGAPDPSLQLDLQGRNEVILAAMNDRSQKTNTFESLTPRGKYSDSASVLDAFLARRAATLDFVRTTTGAVALPRCPAGGPREYLRLSVAVAHCCAHRPSYRADMGSHSVTGPIGAGPGDGPEVLRAELGGRCRLS